MTHVSTRAVVGAAVPRPARRLAKALACAAVALGSTLAVAVPAEASGSVHPCLPGETDILGAYRAYANGEMLDVDVWACIDVGPEVPTPNLPWGSLADGVPCPAGPGVSKVRLNLEGVQSTVWICSDELPPPPPGTTLSKRLPFTAPPKFSPIGSPTRLQPIAPTRVLDTRRPGQLQLAAGETRRVDLSPVLGPSMVAAAVNVTSADAVAPGYFTVWDCASPQPPTSTVNFVANRAAAAGSVVLLDSSRQICVFSSAASHLIVDVNGGYTSSGGFGFTRLTPRRVYDSRPVPVPAGTTTRVSLGSLSRPPSAAFVNLTAVDAAEAGYLTAWPCSLARPEVSNLNFPAGAAAIANAAQVPVDADGSVCVYNSATTGVLVDVFGVFDDAPAAMRYQPAQPLRLLDTRTGIGGWLGTIGNGQVLDVEPPYTGSSGILGTVTLVDPPQAGYVTIDGASISGPRAFSNANMIDATIANMFTSTDVNVVAGPAAGQHVLIDLTGYFVPAS